LSVATVSQVYEPLKSKQTVLYIVGKIAYKDVSGGTGLTEFCLLMDDPDKPDLAFCPTHNDMK